MPSGIRSSARVAARHTETPTKGTKRKVADGDNEIPVMKKPKKSKQVKAKDANAEVEKIDVTAILTPKAEDKSARMTMMDLPAELVYKIAENLRPKDLVNLCDTSPWIWHTLCNKTTVSIWKKSREREEVDEIPRGMNEYYWAKLFFGNRCMECGNDKVTHATAVDFYIRRRLCDPCKKKKYIGHRSANDKKELRIALDLCTTTRISWDGTLDHQNTYSWSDDAVDQKQMLADLRRGQGAKERIASYIESRKAVLAHIRGEAKNLIRLHEDHLENMKAERGDKFVIRYKEVEKRFKGLGYRVGDFPQKLKMHKLVRQKTRLTEQAWSKIRAALEPQIQAIQSERELTERVTLEASRRRMVDELYAQYKFNHVQPTEWKFMPKVHNVCNLPEFAALVKAGEDRLITPADFVPCMDGLGQSLLSAYEETRPRLRARVLAANDSFFDSDLVKTRLFKDLELATIVFRCTICKHGVFGWDDIRSHYCHHSQDELGLHVKRDRMTNRVIDDIAGWNAEFPHTYQYWECGSVAVRRVIESLGMDPRTTTTAELDADPDLRLECWCSGQSRRRCAHKWRILAGHLAGSWHQTDIHETHMKPLKGKVPAESLPGIIQQELEYVAKTISCLACAHCIKHLKTGALTTPAFVKTHLSDVHSIAHPQLNTDYVMLTNARDEYHYYSGTYFDYKERN